MLVFTRGYVCVKAKLTFVSFFNLNLIIFILYIIYIYYIILYKPKT